MIRVRPVGLALGRGVDHHDGTAWRPPPGYLAHVVVQRGMCCPPPGLETGMDRLHGARGSDLTAAMVRCDQPAELTSTIETEVYAPKSPPVKVPRSGL
jgi:hypothetical protein